MNDLLWMTRALTLARATAGLASPNPQVGCVLVRDGQLLGEGAHRYDQRDHAEIVALQQAAAAGLDVGGATAYVTLEPCSHHGRTGPCADALIAAGVARVVVATVDPNPQVSGRGIARLRAAAIRVEIGRLQHEARELNDAFACSITQGRPCVTLKAALSSDGQLAPPAYRRKPGQPFWLTGTEARAEVHRMRHASDALLTGIGTVLADNPQMTDRSSLPRRRPLLRALLDTGLKLPVDSLLVESAGRIGELLVFHAGRAPQATEDVLKKRGVELIGFRTAAGLDLRAVLAVLAERQIRSVLLEAGPTLNGAFLEAGLVDRVALFYAEAELGPEALTFARTSFGNMTPFALEQRLLSVNKEQFGPDVLVTGKLHDPWATVPVLS